MMMRSIIREWKIGELARGGDIIIGMIIDVNKKYSALFFY